MFRRLFTGGFALILALTQALPVEALTATRQPGGDPALMNLTARTAARRASRARVTGRTIQTPETTAALATARRRAVRIGRQSVRRRVSTVTTVAAPDDESVSTVEKQRADAVFELTNQERVNAGLPPLRRNTDLDTAALLHAQDLNKNKYFDHKDRRGEFAGERIKRTGYSFIAYGENIAKGQETAPKVIQDWLDSPGHRFNLLHTSFDEIGIGISGNTWVQNFAQSKDAFEAPADAEETVLSLVNGARTAAGSAPLQSDSRLNEVAAAIVENMRARDAFVYQDANNHSALDLLKGNGFIDGQSAVSILEIAVAGSSSAERAVAKFMQSPQNKRKITDARQRSAGIGISGTYWFLILADK